jgi:hypothetical protein
MAIEDKEIILLKFLVKISPVLRGTNSRTTYNAIIPDIGQADIHETLFRNFVSNRSRVKCGSSSL